MEIPKCTSAIRWRAAIDDLRELLHTLNGGFSRRLPRQRRRLEKRHDATKRKAREDPIANQLPTTATIVFPAASVMTVSEELRLLPVKPRRKPPHAGRCANERPRT